VPPAVGGVNVNAPNQNGYVICIDRIRTEKRGSKPYSRTIGHYQAFYDNEPIPEISGVAVERQGQGDNSDTGVQNHRRLAQGSYPIFTHAGGSNKYRTYGYADPGGLKIRPWPCIGVENTGSRSGVLIHCAQGYLMSIGCINLSGDLPNASADIEFNDSRARVIALIESIKQHLANFPGHNNQEIVSASLIIRGEP